jgi:hypothetical protein
VFVEEMPKRTHLHLQEFGGFGLIAGGFSEGFDDVGLFEVVEVTGEIDAVFGKVELGVYSLRIVICDVIRELLGLNFAGAFESDGPFDRVFKLADIAVPGVIFEYVDRFWGDGSG